MSDDEVEKINSPRGEARSWSSLQPYQVAQNVSFTGDGADWFGPLTPMRPIAPPEVAGRAWDFVPGYNLATEPRTFEPITFHALRSLSESYDPIRLIIERRKDQLCRVPWAIRMKHEGGKRPTSAQLSPQARGLIADVTQFFKHPTENITFRTWLRMLIDDLLVLDAPSIYCERDPGGNLVGLSPIDGSTVRPVIDERGRAPRAFRWDGQPFTWCGTTVTTENYESIGCKIANNLLYLPAFQQILKGLPAASMTTWDLLYKPMNLKTRGVYGCSPIEMLCTTIATAMRRSISQLNYFTEGNQPDAIHGLPESWTPDKIQQFQDYWDSLYSGNLANRRRMKFVPGGNRSNYTALKEPPLKNEFDEWLIRLCCFAFSYPPQAFVALSNRSTAEQLEKTAEEEGVEPIKQWFADLANAVIEREFSDEIEFAWIEEQEVDVVKQKDVLTGYADSGILTVNQVRAKIGEDPDPDPAANMLAVKTATGRVPIGGAEKSPEAK
jgi:Phage portal protein